MRSASKSVISLLVGIAIDRKLIASADEPVVKFFPEYAAVKSPGWDQVTLRHLLTMSSGMQWDENRGWNDPKNDEPHLAQRSRPDPLHPVEADRGSRRTRVWTYNGGGTDLLGNILERVSGKPLEAFAREVLFQPLGITDFEWRKYEERQDRFRHRPSHPAARCRKDRPARAQSRRSGTGRQIVSPEWIEQSVAAALSGDRLFRRQMFYGQQWWMGRSLAQRKEVKWIAALGSGGQRLFIVPDRDLVVMTTSRPLIRPAARATARSTCWPTSSFHPSATRLITGNKP